MKSKCSDIFFLTNARISFFSKKKNVTKRESTSCTSIHLIRQTTDFLPADALVGGCSTGSPMIFL